MKNEISKEFYKLLGLRIKNAREKHIPPMTQENLADSINLSRTSVVNIEQGRHHIQVHTLVEISKELNIPLHELIPEVSGGKVIETPVLTNAFLQSEIESVKNSLLKSTKKEIEINVPEN